MYTGPGGSSIMFGIQEEKHRKLGGFLWCLQGRYLGRTCQHQFGRINRCVHKTDVFEQRFLPIQCSAPSSSPISPVCSYKINSSRSWKRDQGNLTERNQFRSWPIVRTDPFRFSRHCRVSSD
jgi:hypothetical protein